ncbi:hypothetical protein FA15DRAFT_671386 [Coprinopsis marcescibilis]|uniref:Uncharacterized protein n=1 Tax=Coprinopsis marcescibilis TaxID=230819 RepID=A0A5C3KPY0_COPMA|nr:hypothetical protein FA15DRAFT_671386 [Coprinopsis marcescibilis]
MSVAFGCLSLMSLRNPFAELVGLVLGKSDLHSILCLLVFFIVSTVVAYLTNPSENSFRAYLTEQSFRHHLSRLDENLEDEHAVHAPRLPHFSSGYPPRNTNGRAGDSAGAFHFANRASISLRTPKHVFHSFAIFTIAAMVPVAKTSSSSDDRDGWSISDSWYIGAFGKWWRGGVWETWYQDVIARTKDEESWNSGILSIKNLDMLPEFHGPSFTSKTLQYNSIKPSPPKLRNRERVLPKPSSLRSSSPPPLSKSASLPLHAKRVPVPLNEKSNDHVSQALSCPPLHPVASDGIGRLGSAPTSSRSGLFEQSPLIAEILRQISSSSTSVQELRTQLTECQSSASQSHDALQQELDACRDRKRQEDGFKSDLKARTKTLDDSKRTSETVKRDAERKLKAARNTRDTAQRRIEFLDKEIVTLTGRLKEDQIFLVQKTLDPSSVDLELTQALEMKKQDIKAAEDILASLNRRSRELEERLSSERERLRTLKEKSELRRQELSSGFLQDGLYMPTDSPYSTVFEGIPHSAHSLQGIELFGHNGIDASQEQHTLQEFYTNHLPSPVLVNHISPHNGSNYDSFNSSPEDIEQTINFDSAAYSRNKELLSPGNDERIYHNFGVSDPLEDSPPRSIIPTCIVTRSDNIHLANGIDYLPYDGHISVQRPSWSLQAGSDDRGYLQDVYRLGQDLSTVQRQKRLNPDAKAFTFGRKTSPPSLSIDVPYDALNPNGLGMSSLQPATSANASFLRAFAPSPAEREALQRALGGSTNSSFERLPSLSDVGSIPSSPSHLHSSPALPGPSSSTSTKGLQMPSWFPTFQPRKSKFKPWDDEVEEPNVVRAGQTEP